MKTRYIIIGRVMLLAVLSLTAACSNDSDEDTASQQTASVELVSYVSSYTDIESLTRSPGWVPNGYKLFSELTGVSGVVESNEQASISVYFTRDVEGGEPLCIPAQFVYRTSTGKWTFGPGSGEVNANKYHLYGFVPSSAGDATIAKYGTYANGATLTLTNLNSVMNQDVCIIVGAKDGTDENTVTGLQTADFDVTLQNTNYIFLLFDHLYAALRFRFRVDEEYAALRTIKLKKLELLAYTDEACEHLMKKKVSTTIMLQANENGASPIINDITFTPDDTSSDMDAVLIYDNETNPVVLPTGKYPANYEVEELQGEDIYTDNMGFVPKTSSFYTLTSYYDVYDSKGNLIRQDCKAVNKIDPRKLFNMESLNRGYMYTLKLTVKPTYLYVLSEPDLDNPTFEAN